MILRNGKPKESDGHDDLHLQRRKRLGRIRVSSVHYTQFITYSAAPHEGGVTRSHVRTKQLKRGVSFLGRPVPNLPNTTPTSCFDLRGVRISLSQLDNVPGRHLES